MSVLHASLSILSNSFLKNLFQLLGSISTAKAHESKDILATAHAAAWQALSAAKHLPCSWVQVGLDTSPSVPKGLWIDRLSGTSHGYTAVAFRLQLLYEVLESSLEAQTAVETKTETSSDTSARPSYAWLHTFLVQGGAIGIIAAAQDLFQRCQLSRRADVVVDVASCYHGLDAAMSSLLLLCSFLQLDDTVEGKDNTKEDSEGKEASPGKGDFEGKDDDDSELESVVLCGHVGPYAKYQGVYDFDKYHKNGLPIFKRRVVVDKDETEMFLYRCIDEGDDCEWWMVGDAEQVEENEGHLASVENHAKHPVG